MAVTFVAEAHDTTASTMVTPPKPTGTVDGDFMVAMYFGETLVSPTAPPGWTALTPVDSTADSCRLVAYWKVASGEGSSYTWTSLDAYEKWAMIVTLRGSATSAPLSSLGNYDTGVNTTYIGPTISVDTGMSVSCVAPMWIGPVVNSLTVPAGYTARGAVFSASYFTGGIATKSESGSSSLHADWTGNQSTRSLVYHIVVSEAGMGGGASQFIIMVI